MVVVNVMLVGTNVSAMEPPPESDFFEIMKKYLEDSNDNDDNVSSNVINTNCELYEIEELSDRSNCNDSKYSALHLNIHSLPAKFDQLKTILTRLEAASIHMDFVLLCETFLSENNANMFQIPGYNFIYRNRETNRRGGVAMYIRQGIQFTRRRRYRSCRCRAGR